MHEASIMSTALDLASAQVARSGGQRILKLRLRVGELSGVVPDALRFAFEALSKGGPAEGATLEIESISAMYRCRGCDADFEGNGGLSECPRCGAWSEDLRRGLELELTSMEISSYV